ncbi:MAG TPA: hypothetical protein VNJ06_09665 [Gemmatimonadales bacterium]|nr:hypothetical protein [Gemmatimonadales bacterium]
MTRPTLSLLLLLATGCGRGSGGSPTCGIALLAGPGLITSQLSNARDVLTDPPRGIPDSLPALVIQKSNDRGAVIVGRDAEGKISMQFRGPAFPAQGYGLLVVDDTSQRAMGVLILDQEEPRRHPAIGTVIGGSTALNLYGVLVDWASVSNPRCPLFGGPASQTS